jgi:hypothetical protein
LKRGGKAPNPQTEEENVGIVGFTLNVVNKTIFQIKKKRSVDLKQEVMI